MIHIFLHISHILKLPYTWAVGLGKITSIDLGLGKIPSHPAGKGGVAHSRYRDYIPEKIHEIRQKGKVAIATINIRTLGKDDHLEEIEEAWIY